MALLSNQKVSCFNVLKAVKKYGVQETDLTSLFDIAPPTLRTYHNKHKKIVKITAPISKLMALRYVLKKIQEKGYDNPLEVLKELRVEACNCTGVELINEYSPNELVIKLLEQVISFNLEAELPKGSGINEFRKIYTYLNDETIQRAVQEHPELLKRLIDDEELRPSTRAEILEALSIGARPENLDFVTNHIKSELPHMREAVYHSLYNYIENNFERYGHLKKYFEAGVKKESAIGVRKTITDLLGQISGL